MSGTGRPTYKNRKGTANSGEYVPTRHVMVRDMPGHKNIKKRSQVSFNREEMLKKLQTSLGTRVAVHDADDFEKADEDSYSSESESDSSSEDGDDQNALLQELARMKKEKAEEEKKKMQEIQVAMRNQLSTNPLLNPTDYSMEVKWTDETVFHNQAADEPDKKGRYVNDPVRNEYHHKFLRKFLKT